MTYRLRDTTNPPYTAQPAGLRTPRRIFEQPCRTAALNAGGDAATLALSCVSSGNCWAGGFYAGSPGGAFVVNEVSGVWRAAKKVAGTAAFNAGGARIGSVSCASAGNCSAVGFYTDSSGFRLHVFVVNEVSGVWRTAKEVPGTAALNAGGYAGVLSVSCAPAGNCSAGGFYTDSAGNQQAFVVGQN